MADLSRAVAGAGRELAVQRHGRTDTAPEVDEEPVPAGRLLHPCFRDRLRVDVVDEEHGRVENPLEPLSEGHSLPLQLHALQHRATVRRPRELHPRGEQSSAELAGDGGQRLVERAVALLDAVAHPPRLELRPVERDEGDLCVERLDHQDEDQVVARIDAEGGRAFAACARGLLPLDDQSILDELGDQGRRGGRGQPGRPRDACPRLGARIPEDELAALGAGSRVVPMPGCRGCHPR